MNTDAPAWLDIIPPKDMTPGELGRVSGPGDPITVTMAEFGQLHKIMNTAAYSPEQADSLRQGVCRILGPQRVAIVLQNVERGQSTPVVVE